MSDDAKIKRDFEEQARREKTENEFARLMKERAEHYTRQAATQGIDDPAEQQEIAHLAAQLYAERLAAPGRIHPPDDRFVVEEVIAQREAELAQAKNKESELAKAKLSQQQEPTSDQTVTQKPEAAAQEKTAEQSRQAPVARIIADDFPLRLDGTPYFKGDKLTGEMDITNYHWRDVPQDSVQEKTAAPFIIRPARPEGHDPSVNQLLENADKIAQTDPDPAKAALWVHQAETPERLQMQNGRYDPLRRPPNNPPSGGAPSGEPTHDPQPPSPSPPDGAAALEKPEFALTGDGPLTPEQILGRSGNADLEGRFQKQEKDRADKETNDRVAEAGRDAWPGARRGGVMDGFVTDATRKEVEERQAERALVKQEVFGRSVGRQQ